MRGYNLTDIEVSGQWLDSFVSENLIMAVAWRDDGESIKVIEVADCYGSHSGTNYMQLLRVCPELINHLRDMVIERYEV